MPSPTEKQALDYLAANPNPTRWSDQQDEEFCAIERQWAVVARCAEPLPRYPQELRAFFAAHPIESSRTTRPNPIGIRGRSQEFHSMPSATNDFCSLHRLSREQLSDGGFSSAGEFLRTLDSQRHDPRIASLHGAAVTAGITLSSQGGALVPSQFMVDDSLHPDVEAEIMRPGADVRSMTAGALHVAGFDNLSAASGVTYGGLSIECVPEGEEFPLKTPKTVKVTLERKKLGCATEATWELVSDSDYERLLLPALRGAVAYGRDYMFLRGSGVGQPRGVLNSPSCISVAKETGQAAATIYYSNLVKMYSRLHPQSVERSVWVASVTTKAALMELSIPVGTGGSHYPALRESNGTFSLLGRPVMFTSKLPVLGTKGDIMLVDRSQYVIGESPEFFVGASDHYKFLEGKRVWVAFTRLDGQPKWSSAFTPQNGDSLSWAVTLDTRA